MAVSTPPPPPDPFPSTTSAATTTTTTRPHLPPNPRPSILLHTPALYSTTTTTHPHQPTIPRLPSNPNPNYPRLVPSPHQPTATTTAPSTTAAAILYPVASSGRGFISRQIVSSVASTSPSSKSNPYPVRPSGLSSYSRPSFGFAQPDPRVSQGTVYVSSVGNPTHLLQAGVVGNSAVKAASVSAPFPQSQHKIALSATAVSNFNGHKDLRERSKDDAFAIVNDRKVRASDNTSLYALCRSWLKNGVSEESQLQNLDEARSLPRPLPLPAEDDTSPTRMEESEEVEDEGSVENLTQKELLQRYVKRAKRVRSRIREQRLRRIAPYKTRLALLLRPMVDSNWRNDSATGELK